MQIRSYAVICFHNEEDTSLKYKQKKDACMELPTHKSKCQAHTTENLCI